MKLFCVCCAALCVAAAVHAGDDIRGKISSIDPAAGTLEISGVKVNAKDAAVKGLIPGLKSNLDKLKEGDYVHAEGAFTGSRAFTAKEVEKIMFSTEEIQGKIGEVDANKRTLEISGIEVSVPEDVEIEDDDGNPLALEKLPRGKVAKVDGSWTGPAQFTAKSVELDDDED